MNFISSLANTLFEFIFPKSEKILSLERMETRDIARSLPPAEATSDSDTIAIFAYEHPVVREMIWELKYRGNRLVAEKLARVLMDMLREELAEREQSENFSDVILVPMPISDKRRNKRGYNQTEILASEMKKLDQRNLFKLVKGQLVKHRHTDSQTLSATRAERLKNLEGAMHVVHKPRVEGKCVILLDDVTTTGATFKEAKRALREAGARKILCLAAAH